ncbi:unnamed protein product [Heligmosomoides polygyrus]|uniref:Uncharacterized protein n=1 Tax=Heligmosomoides polygyrus TaxID=6339 RepID=A0A183G7S7_HELPZ|nr:unnamed protein product [Heligmosomoides polygyrus]
MVAMHRLWFAVDIETKSTMSNGRCRRGILTVSSPRTIDVGGYRGAEVIGDGFQPSLLSDSYRSPFRSSGPLGAYRPMAAIVPVNHRKQRQIAVFPPRGMQCCTGAAFETRPCRVECEVPRPCEWSEWGEWCGCTRCRVAFKIFFDKGGKEVRRRFCDRGSSQGAPSLPDSSCNCLGQDTDTRNCAVEKDCDKHRTPNDGGVSQDYGRNALFIFVHSQTLASRYCKPAQLAHVSSCVCDAHTVRGSILLTPY